MGMKKRKRTMEREEKEKKTGEDGGRKKDRRGKESWRDEWMTSSNPACKEPAQLLSW